MATSYNSTDAFWNYRDSITKVVFENKLVPKENAIYSFDVSEEQNGSVMSYLVANEENSETYTLYLQGDGNIKANENSEFLFYKFTNLIEIENLEYLETDNVTSMRAMFQGCRSLINLDVSTFNTSNVINMAYMFAEVEELETLDLSHFNTSNVTNMVAMFYSCGIEYLDISNFDISNISTLSGVFNRMHETTPIIKVKDAATQQEVLSSSNRPASWTTDNVIVAS